MSSLPNEATMVPVTRDDLKLSKGKLAAHVLMLQIISTKVRLHAFTSAEYSRKIVVEPKMKTIRQLYAKALQGLFCDLVKDQTYRNPTGNGYSLGIGPAPRAAVDAITGDLKLL